MIEHCHQARTPDDRRILTGHARFFLHASRVLRSVQLADPGELWRTIECTRADVDIIVIYYRLHGCIITTEHVGETVEGGLGPKQPVISSENRKFEPISSRLKAWRTQLKTRTPALTFQQQVRFRARLFGFRPPLRQGRKPKLP